MSTPFFGPYGVYKRLSGHFQGTTPEERFRLSSIYVSMAMDGMHLSESGPACLVKVCSCSQGDYAIHCSFLENDMLHSRDFMRYSAYMHAWARGGDEFVQAERKGVTLSHMYYRTFREKYRIAVSGSLQELMALLKPQTGHCGCWDKLRIPH
jgi:hypothetical protein